MNHFAKALLLIASTTVMPATALAGTAPESMCGKSDQVVFSCPLAGSTKTVSMCAAGDVAHGTGRFYYAYGRPAKPELTYPAPGNEGEFTRTHLTFAGNTGGYAYGFTNAGFKYIVYSISGSSNLQEGGLVVLKDDQATPVKHSACQAGNVTDTDEDALIDATLKWKSDPIIEKNGIPSP
ncbi:hypothetical protein [Luteibacter sp. SG786]|uniref:hypothetical protein n=1 Tax=Luteibacter sp. SG786 TaxID=2587130 RepID=UPI00141D7C5B|nr:hypothetical protein [Luteibacter sp. SG786]NII53263.1 hypothetical protein [Luteibacter sp. SG786]